MIDSIGDFSFRNTNRTFIVAELSANHNQDFSIAVKTIEAAAKTGADAIKIQTYTADTITIDCDNDYFKIKQGTLWDGKTLYQLYKEAYTPWEWQAELKQIAEKNGLIFFSSPFDFTAVDFLEKLQIPVYKIASFEITDIPLIEYVASKGKPLILSTGIANEEDIQLAINACLNKGNKQIALLKCTSAYPAPIEEANLLTIPDMAKKFNVTSGLSDHTLSNSVSVAAVALGARIIEKHFILDRNIGGPDAQFSLQPKEFEDLVKSIREVEKAKGVITYDLTEKAKNNRYFSRSLFCIKDIEAGEEISDINVRSIRPGIGLHPKYFKEIMGKKAIAKICKGTPMKWDLVSS